MPDNPLTEYEPPVQAREPQGAQQRPADVAALSSHFNVDCLQRARDYGLTDADLVGWTEETLDNGLLAAAIFQGLPPRRLASWMQQSSGDLDRVWAAWAAHSVEG